MPTRRASALSSARRDASSFDVIVIGGGLAGIAATHHLTQAGRRVALVEARSRFGGRVWTLHEPSIDHPIELGAEWFDGYGTIHRLLASQHSPMPAAAGKFWRRVGTELHDIEESVDGWVGLQRRLQQLEGPDRSLARALAECSSDSRYAEAAQMLRGYVSGFHAADPEEVSLEWFRQVEANQPAEASELRSRAGLDRAVNALLSDIGLSCTAFLDTAVLGVRWRRGDVRVDCASDGFRGTLRAGAAVVTLPHAVLRLSPGAPGAVRFTPALSAKQRALDLMATGPVLKVNLVFDAQFWRDLPKLDDMSFVQDFSQPFPTWWSTLPTEAPLLMGWAAGPQVAKVGSLQPAALQRTAVRSLAHALHVPPRTVAARLIKWHWHNWQDDPRSQGGYTWVRTGGQNAYKVLAAPLARALYFAGEATCGEGFNATMDGAIQSGRRAAAEILAGG